MGVFGFLVFNAHSMVRWLVLVVAFLAILKYAWGWLKGTAFKKLDHGLGIAFPLLISLQALLGLTYFFWTGFTTAGFPRFRFEHGASMLVAVACAYIPLRWRNAADSTRFRNGLIAILASVASIVVGISRLPGGLTR